MLWYFREDWLRLIRAGIVSIAERRIGDDPNRRLAWLPIIACIPGGIAGVLLAERLARHVRMMQNLTLRDALLIGLAQAFAVFPGVSRSGATITAGLALGLERESAARFSFLLSAPIIAGAGAKSLVEIYGGITSGAIAQGELILFPIGVIAAAISGFLTIQFLMRYLQRHSNAMFVYYRWVPALLVIAVALLRG